MNIEIKNPYNQKVVGTVCQAQEKDIEEAIQKSVQAFEITKQFSSFERSEILKKIIQGLELHEKELAETISQEMGKTIREAQRETSRSINTFTLAMEESKRLLGEVIPLDHLSTTKSRVALTKRFPIGPILAISPFNYPLNLVSHKVAPALACGNTVILKPPPQAPITSLKLAKIIMESGLPDGAFSVLPCKNELAEKMVQDSRFKMLTFTGSARVGWHLKALAPKKKVILELGGIAATIIDEGVPLDKPIERCVYGAFSGSGQICISVQTIYIHEKEFENFKSRFLKAMSQLKMGDPLDEKTDIGPLIDELSAKRVESWIEEAKQKGALVLCGGKRKNNFIEPTALTQVTADMKVCSEEIFGPVVNLIPFKKLEDVYRSINQLPYGLQAGIFTNNIQTLFQAYEQIQVGSLIHNDIPTFRVDHMPYGGVKESGYGREGIKYAMEQMTEVKMLALNLA
ncbi:MAG: aldehyde dehydrogenase family protein [Deltaproteobacteria bacterium]|nr:aldehyde dehydrogenase family protein [Deltaproteobacteria bacterium]